jgi:hypothetical protein
MTKDTLIGKGVGFNHICRITGYLAKIERFNSAKRAEVHDRVKHDMTSCTEEEKLVKTA